MGRVGRALERIGEVAKEFAHRRRAGRKRRSGLKVAAYVGLGLVSAGILAAVLAIALAARKNWITSSSSKRGKNWAQ